MLPRDRYVSWRRLLAAGLAAAVAVGIGGGVIELWRFGASDAAAAKRVEVRVQRDFAEITAALSGVASVVASSPIAASALEQREEGARALFDLLARARATAPDGPDVAVTAYDAGGVARAWAGRASDLPESRIGEPAAFFVTPSPLGLRLVHIRPIVDSDSRRRGAVATEHLLSPAAAAATMTAVDFSMSTPIAPVALRLRYEGAGERTRSGAFLLRSPTGEALAEASVAPADLHRARREWRRFVLAAVLATSALAVLLLIGPVLDRRASTRNAGAFARYTGLGSVLLVGGLAAIAGAFAVATGVPPRFHVVLLLAGTCAAALIALWAGVVARRRLAFRQHRRAPDEQLMAFLAAQLFAGIIVAVLLIVSARLFSRVVGASDIDLREFSLHPWSNTRAALLAVTALLTVHISVLWSSTLIFVAAPARWRVSRRWRERVRLLSAWLLPTVVLAALSWIREWPFPSIGLLASGLVCGVAAVFGQRLATWYRHMAVAARILALFVAFLTPALLLYPSIDFFAERATRRLITTRYAVEAQNHVQRLQEATYQATREIDSITTLPDLVTDEAETGDGMPRTDSAFLVWGQTVLKRERLTSAVELYDLNGGLVSRFGFNFPEYTGSAQKPQASGSCEWDVFGEAQPFGSDERQMLHAQKSICIRSDAHRPTKVVGTVVVHVMFDYRSLPFISSQSPYFELFRPAENRAPVEGAPGGDVDLAIYGWGLHAIYTSGRSAWSITDDLFARLYDAARRPFWARITRGDTAYHVYFSNDRSFIYAVGYSALTLFDHLVHLAELATLAGVAFIAVLIGTAIFTRLSREHPRVGRALLREIRASFYRKLFLAFVLASVIPVLTLAFVIRAYFIELLGDAVQAEATRTAAVAQRVIQESNALWRRNATEIAPPSDDVMVSISQILDQDVNYFVGAQLIATSKRDLFSSGLLPTRTPDDVYRGIVLDRLPSFVDQDQIGTFSYLIAAAPVRAGEQDAILTVPLANRQREIDRETDDLDRGVRLASLLFILLGAGIGLPLAERIADPVRRLTRATRRIAAGDFDARIAVRTADELKRLVDAFNSMAAELKAQRAQLERTHRVEAWAEMARQVAHEIKNPLTPIQLSAEHLRRVHADRGAPMGEVLDTCITTILGQVRLLRQISAEFSSFASSPVAKPAPVDVPTLVAEVIDPYRTGLEGRIEIVNRVAGPLPPVYVDRTLIARALANIVENALHAMPASGRITIDAAADDRVVTVELSDTGVGMDDEALARIFEPYFSTKTTGTGLGLPISRRNVEINGGTIEVSSRKGAGTRVVVRLPIAGRDGLPDRSDASAALAAPGVKE
jgi:signal transduction histidine kinase